MSTVYLNGQFLPLEQATVPIMDRGFLFGDGVYEVIPVYGERLFRLTHHLHRLGNSLDAIRLAKPFPDERWREILTELVKRNGGGDQTVYLQVTRGVAEKRDHAFPKATQATVLAMTSGIPPRDAKLDEHGVRAITLDDIRWRYCHIKAITLLPNVLLRQQAIDNGAQEAILVIDGHAVEGAASNLFVVANGLLITPAKGPKLLPGVTRDLILELAVAHGIPFREADIPIAQLHGAEEVWLTSSTREILPVTELDERPIGAGKPGPVYLRMTGLYQDYKAALRAGTAD